MQDGSKAKLDVNLITSCSNVLKVYTINDKTIDLRVTSTFNDRIIDVIRIPTTNFRLQTKDFKAPLAPKQKQQPQKSGKLLRSIRRVVDIEEQLQEQVQEI